MNARQIAFEAKVAAVSATTIASMICNALNNDPRIEVTYVRAEVLPKMPACINAQDVATVDVETKLASLQRYMLNTDWSAFKRWDHEAAVRSLTAGVN